MTAPNTTTQPRRQITIYECPDCGERLLGEQRCDTCHTFTRRSGIGGTRPHCDEPVAITDLIDQSTDEHTGQLFVAASGQKPWPPTGRFHSRQRAEIRGP